MPPPGPWLRWLPNPRGPQISGIAFLRAEQTPPNCLARKQPPQNQ